MHQQSFRGWSVCLYQFCYTIGVLSFTFATFSSLPFFDEPTSSLLFIFLIRVAACFSAAGELLELIAAPIPMWRTPLCLLSLVGQVLYIKSTNEMDISFNMGLGYVLATLCTSISAEFKILALILERRNFEQIMLKEKHRFFQYGCTALGSVIFLIGTLILSLSQDKTWAISRAGFINFIGGIIYAASIVMMFKKEKYQGYKRFRQSMQVPSVIGE